MATKTFNLSIPAGTIVFRNVNGASVSVILQADIRVESAVRQDDGGFIYHCGGYEYFASAGNCAFAENLDAAYGWRHKDGLVTLIG